MYKVTTEIEIKIYLYFLLIHGLSKRKFPFLFYHIRFGGYNMAPIQHRLLIVLPAFVGICVFIIGEWPPLSPRLLSFGC